MSVRALLNCGLLRQPLSLNPKVYHSSLCLLITREWIFK